MLKQRLMTAAILWVVAIVGILYLPTKWFALVATIIVGLLAWEYSFLIGLHRALYRTFYTIIAILAIRLAFYIPMFYLFLVAFIIWLWIATALISYAKQGPTLGLGSNLIKGVIGIIIFINFWVAINILRQTSLGPVLLIFVFLLVWSVDTGAFFVGRQMGNKKLIPRVSPNKTWEGLIGGLVLCILVAVIYAFARHLRGLSFLMLIILAVITGIFSVVGDLYESMLKRQANVKDSGNIFPGHGGILDRLDSALAALPIFTLGILFFGA